MCGANVLGREACRSCRSRELRKNCAAASAGYADWMIRAGRKFLRRNLGADEQTGLARAEPTTTLDFASSART